jgi:HK97 family phage portal protein
MAFWNKKQKTTVVKQTYGMPNISDYLSGISFGDGKSSRSTSTILAAYNQSPWLKSVVSKVSYNIGAARWRLYRNISSTKKSITKDIYSENNILKRNAIIKLYTDTKQLEEVFSHPLLDILERPNVMTTGLEQRKACQVYVDLCGEMFLLILREKNLQPAMLEIISPSDIVELPSKNNSFKYKMSVNGSQQSVDPNDILKIIDFNPKDPRGRGFGIAQALADELDTDESAALLTRNVFRSGGLPPWMMGVEGADADEIARAAAQFNNRHLGAEKSGAIWWHNGKLNAVKLGHDFKELAITDLRKFERDAIVSVYGCPPEILGLVDNSNRATIEQATVIMAQQVVIPRLEIWRLLFQHWLLPQYKGGENLVIAYDDPTPESEMRQLEKMRSSPQSFTVAEWRGFAGYDTRGDSDDVHLVPAGLTAYKPSELSAVQSGGSAGGLFFEQENKVEKKIVQNGQSAMIKKELSEAEINEIIASLSPDALAQYISPLWREEMRRIAEETLTDLGSIDGLEASMARVNPLIERYIREVGGEKISIINDTTAAALREQLTEGIKSGESIRELSTRVSEVFDTRKSPYELERIARTEVIGASNAAAIVSMEVSGVVDGKEWISTMDGRTRDSHIDMDGQEVPLHEPFKFPNGATAQFPGGTGLPSEDINCRCTIAATSKDVDADGVETKALSMERKSAIWKRFDEQATRWERKAMPLLAKGFTQQQSMVIEKLYKLDKT